jgi:hypothetical protein
MRYVKQLFEDSAYTAIFAQMGFSDVNAVYLEPELFLENVKECAEGRLTCGVNGFIYYYETNQFYKDNQIDIDQWVDESFDFESFVDYAKGACGSSPSELLGQNDVLINNIVWDYVTCVIGAIDIDKLEREIKAAVDGRDDDPEDDFYPHAAA